MSKDYTYSELVEMQRQATERAMEMNSRATTCHDCSDGSDEPKISDFHKDPVDKICACDECKNIRCDKNPAFRKERKEHFSLLNMEEDTLLILALMLILSKNSNDNLLVLALLYIMM